MLSKQDLVALFFLISEMERNLSLLEMPEPLNPGSDEDRWLLDAELIMQATLDKEEASEKLSIDHQEKEDETVVEPI